MPAARSIALTWRRQQAGTAPLDRWYAYGPSPADACGGVWRERGLWRAEVWPRGRKVLGAYYRNPAKARQHIERWLRSHPEVVAAAFDPRGSKGRLEDRPKHLLIEYLRTCPGPVFPKAPW